VALLNGRLELHQPGCDHRHCAPNECVRDVEAFCGAVLEKFNRGERVGHQPGGHAFQSRDDHDEALQNLIGASWKAWLDFNPRDDGRGTNRFGGYLSWVLYRRHTDWLRKRYGSTRYGPVAMFTTTADPEQHITEGWLDPDYEGDYEDVFDIADAPAGTREAIELIRPLLDGEVETPKEVAARAQVEKREVEKALALVRTTARRQGLEPGGEKRRALANRVRDLHESGMRYREIGEELGLSGAGASGLFREYFPELAKRGQARRTLSSNGDRPRESLSGTPTKGNPCCRSSDRPRPGGRGALETRGVGHVPR
jgi:hypothetical protein